MATGLSVYVRKIILRINFVLKKRKDNDFRDILYIENAMIDVS